MKKFILGLAVLVMFVGCTAKEEANNGQGASNEVEQRKEASRKLTVQSMSLLGKEDYKDALAGLDAAIRIDPTNPDPYLVLGQVLIKSGEYERAQDFLDNAAKNLPDNGMIFYMLATAHKMADKKLPAALAARRSFELFKNGNDKDGAQRAALLLQSVIEMPDQPNAK